MTGPTALQEGAPRTEENQMKTLPRYALLRAAFPRTVASLAMVASMSISAAPIRGAADSPSVANPAVEGPISGGIRGGAYNRTRVDLFDDYVEEEFFISGTAVGTAGLELPYKTRIHVRRPTDPARFNGGVVLDWTNVSVPDDTDVNWVPMHITIMQRGYVYVAVAAQRLAIDASPIALRQYDPVRYGSLLHPGEDFAYNIFAQAAEAVLDPAVLGDLAPLVTRRLAVGASQSAIKLTDYVNEYAEQHGVIDGVMPQINDPNNIRHDVVPVLFLNSQNELRDADPVADDEGFVLWEMAGPSHAPLGYAEYQNTGYVFHETNGMVDLYDEETALAWGYQLGYGECTTPNTFDAGHLYSAALVALDNWVVHGKRPRGWRADRSGGVLQFDALDNLKGGMRSPLIEAPIARYYSHSIPDGAGPCAVTAPAPLIGSTEALREEDLRTRYGTTDAYVREFEAAVAQALADEILLPEGADELLGRLPRAEAWVAAVLGPRTGDRDGEDLSQAQNMARSDLRDGGAAGWMLIGLLGWGALARRNSLRLEF
jgi:hypothetical protein